jgi:phosphate transport system substrate-binding protein
VEDSHSSGRIAIVTARAAEPVMARLKAAFEGLYPMARIDIRSHSSSEAIRALYAAEADLAVTTRELLPEERRAAVQGRLELEGYRFARDGLVVVVHPDQEVENLALEEVRAVYRGEATNWREFGGADRPIVPVVQAPGADANDFFAEAVMRGEPMTAPAWQAAGDSAAAGYVSIHPGAVGYVTLPWAEKGVHAMRLASLRGLDYVAPDAERVYEGRYPLTRYYHLYIRPDGARLAAGFVTFATSLDGQREVVASGLVPTTVPVRFARRSPMRATH